MEKRGKCIVIWRNMWIRFITPTHFTAHSSLFLSTRFPLSLFVHPIPWQLRFRKNSMNCFWSKRHTLCVEKGHSARWKKEIKQQKVIIQSSFSPFFPHFIPDTSFSIQPSPCLRFLCYWFHVLFHSHFWVLFNFPSLYLFAIGLSAVFNIKRHPPLTLGSSLNEPDSFAHQVFFKTRFAPCVTGLSPSSVRFSKRITRAAVCIFRPRCALYNSRHLVGPGIFTLCFAMFTRRY